ncbi:MAG: sugar phosphate isomerase/epimerase [Candidatus Glassbacteria bacterium]|nr:sugar phosphate isomerase/epimerase [Candidatus Glassbacteria bacterium]
MKNSKDSGMISRREMFTGGALAALVPLAACGSQQAGGGKSEGASAGRATRNMQLSLAAYSMRDFFKSGEMDLFEFIDWCAEMDLPGTELTSYYFKEGFDKAYLRELRRHAFRCGVTVSGTAIANDFCKPAGPELDAEVENVRKWIDNAAELFAPHIRIFAGKAPEGVDIKTAIAWCAEGIKRSLEYAAERGITLGLENHGGITARAVDHLEICRAVGEHPWFGVNLDTGNYQTNPYEELAMSAPLAVNVQVKVLVSGADGKREETNLERIGKILLDAGYKGWVALEYEEEDPKVNIPKWIDRMKKTFGC